MKDNRGFTLIEMICVLVIFGILSSLVAVQFMGTIKNSRVTLNAEQKERLVKTAEDITLNNKKCLTEAKELYINKAEEQRVKILLDDMKSFGYLSTQSIQDLEENTKLTGCVTVIWNETYSKFDYAYEDSCETITSVCNIKAESERVIVSGFYAEDGNPQYTNKKNVTYYLNYSANINSEYCVTLGNEASCSWLTLNPNKNSLNGNVSLLKENEENTIHLYIRNSNKNIISSMEDTIYYDTIKPTCTWLNPTKSSINNGGIAEITLRCVDTSGISNNELLSSAITTSNPSLVSVSQAFVSTDGLNKDFKFTVIGLEGNGNVTFQYNSDVIKDNAGNLAGQSTNTKNIVVDNIAPNGEIYVKSNGIVNNRYSNKTTIELGIDNPTDIELVCLSSTTYCDNWQSYKSTFDWTLTVGDGPKSIYVSFKDRAGNVVSKNTSVYLDTVRPNCIVTNALATIALNKDSYTDYNVYCTDLVKMDTYEIVNSDLFVNNPSLAKAEVVSSENNVYVIRVTAFAGNGNVSVYIKQGTVNDYAGNNNEVVNVANLVIDNIPPQNNSIVINRGSTITSNINISVGLISDISSGYYCLKSTNNITGCEWNKFLTTASYAIEKVNKNHTVYAFFKDLAGNVTTETISDNILYRDTAITCNLTIVDNNVVINTQYANIGNVTNPYSWNLSDWTSSNQIPLADMVNYYMAFVKDEEGYINYCDMSIG